MKALAALWLVAATLGLAAHAHAQMRIEWEAHDNAPGIPKAVTMDEKRNAYLAGLDIRGGGFVTGFSPSGIFR